MIRKQDKYGLNSSTKLFMQISVYVRTLFIQLGTSVMCSRNVGSTSNDGPLQPKTEYMEKNKHVLMNTIALYQTAQT